MPRKPPDWNFAKLHTVLTKWIKEYDGWRAATLEEELADRQVAMPPFAYATNLNNCCIETASHGALQVLNDREASGWRELHRAWRSTALFTTSQIQHKDYRLAEFHKNNELIPPNYRAVDALDLNKGALAWCEAVVFHETRYLRMWGDRIVTAVSSREPLLPLDVFATFGGAPFEYFIVQLHARWHQLPFQYTGRIPKDWPVYAKVFETWDGSLSRFRDAVHGICDYHCNHCWDYADTLHEAFLPIPFEIFPVEILALKKIRESMGLPFPELDHKLVNDNPLFHPPDPIPKATATDEWEIKTIAKMREVFPQLKLPFNELPLDPYLSKPATKPKKVTDRKPAAKAVSVKKAIKKKKPKT